MAVQKIFQGFTRKPSCGDFQSSHGHPRRGEQLCALEDDHASPQFRWDRHGQVMTLSDREGPKPWLGRLGRLHIAETGTSEIDAIERWS